MDPQDSRKWNIFMVVMFGLMALIEVTEGKFAIAICYLCLVGVSGLQLRTHPSRFVSWVKPILFCIAISIIVWRLLAKL